MSHTPARTKQTDIEHIQMAGERFGQIVSELQEALQASVSDDAKIALIALMEIARSGAATAQQCLEQIHRSQTAPSAVH